MNKPGDASNALSPRSVATAKTLVVVPLSKAAKGKRLGFGRYMKPSETVVLPEETFQEIARSSKSNIDDDLVIDDMQLASWLFLQQNVEGEKTARWAPRFVTLSNGRLMLYSCVASQYFSVEGRVKVAMEMQERVDRPDTRFCVSVEPEGGASPTGGGLRLLCSAAKGQLLKELLVGAASSTSTTASAAPSSPSLQMGGQRRNATTRDQQQQPKSRRHFWMCFRSSSSDDSNCTEPPTPVLLRLVRDSLAVFDLVQRTDVSIRGCSASVSHNPVLSAHPYCMTVRLADGTSLTTAATASRIALHWMGAIKQGLAEIEQNQAMVAKRAANRAPSGTMAVPKSSSFSVPKFAADELAVSAGLLAATGKSSAAMMEVKSRSLGAQEFASLTATWAEAEGEALTRSTGNIAQHVLRNSGATALDTSSSPAAPAPLHSLSPTSSSASSSALTSPSSEFPDLYKQWSAGNLHCPKEFRELCGNDPLQQLFLSFSRTVYVEDTASFWIAVDSFKRNFATQLEKKDGTALQSAKNIISEFVDADGSQAVEISPSVRAALLALRDLDESAAVSRLAFDMFDSAQREVEAMLVSDVWIRFLEKVGELNEKRLTAMRKTTNGKMAADIVDAFGGSFNTDCPPTLRSILMNDRQRGALRNFARSVLAEENVLFWALIQKFKSATCGDVERMGCYDEMFLDFIPGDSKCVVNIAGSERAKLINLHNNKGKDQLLNDRNLFDRAESECMKVMELDLYPKFLSFMKNNIV